MAAMPSTLAQQLAQRDRPPVILDGGLATELERRGQDVSGALWSARVLRDAPEVIRATHAAYFAAGAQVATTASYQATYGGFGAIGVTEEETTELLRRSVRLADEARTAAQDDDRAAGRPARPRWVAASVGPYGAMLADGSEYRGDYGLTVAQLRDFHRPRLQVLARACLDLADGGGGRRPRGAGVRDHPVAGRGRGPGRASWPAWGACLGQRRHPAGDRLRSGEPLVEAFRAAAAVTEVIAVGVNCCEPSDVAIALAIAAEADLGVPVIAYPNTGEGWDAAARAWTGRPTLDAVAGPGLARRRSAGPRRLLPRRTRALVAYRSGRALNGQPRYPTLTSQSLATASGSFLSAMTFLTRAPSVAVSSLAEMASSVGRDGRRGLVLVDQRQHVLGGEEVLRVLQRHPPVGAMFGSVVNTSPAWIWPFFSALIVSGPPASSDL